MTLRRLLMTAGAAAPAIVPTDPPDGGGGGTDPGDGWPATTDPTLTTLRPSGRVVGTQTATDSATRDAAAAALLADLDAASRGNAGYWDGIGPDYRTTLNLEPGTYTGGGQSAWRVIVGTDPTSRSVLDSNVANGGTIHSFGSIYLENLHIKSTTNPENTAPKYPWHITGGEMCIAANCTFDLSQIDPDTVQGGEGIAGWVGADGSSGMTILLYKCDFIPGPIANVLNIHGPGGELTLPMTLIFVDCTGLDGVEVFAAGEVATVGGGSSLYAINTPLAGIGAAAGCAVYTDGDAPAMAANAGTINRDVTSWPVPDGGLSAVWQDHYYPSALGDEPFDWEPTVPDAAPMAPVVGRTYITRVDPDVALRITHSGFTATTTAGNYGIVHRAADSPYVRDEPVTAENLAGGSLPVVAGKNEWKHPYFYTRYPGDNGVWVKVAWTNSAVRVTGSAALPGITDCYYTDDGTTLVPVAEGTPHPVPFVRAV